MKDRRLWYFCILGALMLMVLTFTPLVTPESRYKPMLLGMPYTVWTGILVSVALVLLTFIGTRVHPGRKNDEE